MGKRSGAATRAALRFLGVAACVAGVVFSASAADDKPAMPAALSDYVARIEAEAAFRECVGAFTKDIDDAVLIDAIAAKGLAPDLYAAVAKEFDDPDAVLRDDGFVPAHAQGDQALAEKAMVLTLISVRRSTDAEDPALDSLAPANRFYLAANEAVAAGCAVPAHLGPGDPKRAQAEAMAGLMGEAQRVETCAKAEIEARGIDEDAAYALLEPKGLESEFRSRVAAMLAQFPGVDPAQRDQLVAAEAPAHVARGLNLMSATTFDLESMAKAMGLNAIYLDLALDGKCTPSGELKDFIGAANSANH